MIDKPSRMLMFCVEFVYWNLFITFIDRIKQRSLIYLGFLSVQHSVCIDEFMVRSFEIWFGGTKQVRCLNSVSASKC